MRMRVTVRDTGVELRGYVDDGILPELARAMEPFALVMASPEADDYDPFDETVETLREDVAVLERLRAWDIRTIDRLDKAMADVWDAGYRSGAADGESGNHVFDPALNPYRGETK